MSYFVIDKECANKIYDNDDFEISLKKFKSEEEANNYLNGVTKSPMLISLEKKSPGKILPNRMGKRWEDSEEIELLEEIKNGLDFQSVADKHGRTLGGIIGRLKGVALRLHNLDTPMEEIIRITRLNRTDIFDFIHHDEMKKSKKLNNPKPVKKNYTELESDINDIKSQLNRMNNNIEKLCKLVLLDKS